MSILVVILLSLATLFSLLLLFSMPLEEKDLLLKYASGVLAGLTFMVGIGALVTAHTLGNRQAEKIARLEKETAEAKQKQAEAELQLDYLRRNAGPRRVLGDKFLAALNGKDKGTVEIMYREGDSETEIFALEISSTLERADWKVSAVKPTSEGIRDDEGIIIYASKIESIPLNNPSAFRGLADALATTVGRFSARVDETLPANHFRIMIGTKR